MKLGHPGIRAEVLGFRLQAFIRESRIGVVGLWV